MKRLREEESSYPDESKTFLNPITKSPFTNVYYEFLLKRAQLPVASFKLSIQERVCSNSVLLLTGETGSGKTTQIPHFVAEMPTISGIVACTQPRRVAAMSVAQRVSQEVGSVLGAHVGYNVRFDNKTSSATRLAYYTDGMLLREFVNDPNITKFGAVIVDEAHERTVDTDLLLGLLKGLVERRPSFRVIVMSATLDMITFQSYFPSAPLIAVPGRVFPVDIKYSDTTVSSDAVHLARASADKAMTIHRSLGTKKGDILIFLPGEAEIQRTILSIEDSAAELQREGESLLSVTILPLYGSLSLEEQSKVFESLPATSRKIVCATNIAETSLTIDGIVYVVDSCYHKQSLYNPTTRVNFLLPTHVSKASANQRAGRAGRTQHGECHRLMTEQQFEQLPDQSYPEILRCETTSTILTILRLGYASPFAFPFISSPSRQNFLDGYMNLGFLGALAIEGGAITDDGKLFAEFPTSPTAARAIVKGSRMGCSVDVAMIISMLEAGTAFRNSFRDAPAADVKRAKFIDSEGDHLTLFKVFHGFISSKQSPEWCREHFIQFKVMQQAVNIFRQLSTLMDRLKITRNSTFVRETGSYDSRKVRRALFEGYFTHTALFIPGEAVPYRTVREQQNFTLHPSSTLSKSRPQWIVYNSLEMQGGSAFARVAMRAEPEWFLGTCPEYFDWTEIENITPEVRSALKGLAQKPLL